MKKALGIVCRQEEYTKRLCEELCRGEFRDWQLAAFTSLPDFYRWDEKEDVAVLLLEEHFFSEWEAASEASFCKTLVIWLSEDKEACLYTPWIFMYQSSEQISRRLSALFREQTAKKFPEVSEVRKEGAAPEPEGLSVIGVLSPCGGMGVTSFSYACAKELVKQGTTVFLSLDPYTGLSDVPKDARSLSELMYLLHEYGADWTAHKEHCVHRQGRLEIIAGMADASDLWELGKKQWKDFLSGLRQCSGISFLVIDCAAGCMAREDVLEACGRLFLLGEEGSLKVEQWKERFLHLAHQTQLVNLRKSGVPEREWLRSAGLMQEGA